MNKLLDRLGERDRRLLAVAVPVVVVLMLMIGARELVAQHSLASGHRDRTLEDIAWLQAQRADLPSAGRNCPAVEWSPAGITTLAGRYGVELAGQPGIGGGELRLTISAAQGNQVLELMETLTCQGGQISRFSLETVDGTGAVRGDLVALMPVT